MQGLWGWLPPKPQGRIQPEAMGAASMASNGA